MTSMFSSVNVHILSALRRCGAIVAAAALLGGAAMLPSAASAAPPAAPSGGPFVSILSADAVSPRAADPKFRSLFATWSQADKGRAAIAIPSQEPLTDFVLTSGFGVRTDPFRGSFAMHPGIDMAAPYGTPVYATADGIVARAGPSTGYGNLVEIDHGRGIHTRYGHLSSILTSVNARVRRGELIGRVGSTGRSTGNHLHYEVRLDDRAINPMPFVQGAGYVMAARGQAVPAPVTAAISQVAMLGSAPAVTARPLVLATAQGTPAAAGGMGGPAD